MHVILYTPIPLLDTPTHPYRHPCTLYTPAYTPAPTLCPIHTHISMHPIHCHTLPVPLPCTPVQPLCVAWASLCTPIYIPV